MADSQEIKIKLTRDDYWLELRRINAALQAAGVDVEVTAECVARTYAARAYGNWLEEQDVYWADHLIWATDADGEVMLGCATCQHDDVWLVWTFDMDDERERSAALLFKLTFGGR